MGLDLTKQYDTGDYDDDGAAALVENGYTSPKKLLAAVRGRSPNGQKKRTIEGTKSATHQPATFLKLNNDQKRVYDLVQMTCADYVDFGTAKELGIVRAANKPSDSDEVVLEIAQLTTEQATSILNTFEMSTVSQRAAPLLDKYVTRGGKSKKKWK